MKPSLLNTDSETERMTKPAGDETVLIKDTIKNQLLPDQNNKRATNECGYNLDFYLIVMRFRRYIGKGGMGTVYLAKDLRLKGKLWAIKEIHMNPDSYQEFVDEAKMLVALEHANFQKSSIIIHRMKKAKPI